MTVGLRDFVPELGRQPLLFRETFQSRASVERNGATIVGTGTTFGPDGVTFDGNGNLLYNVAGPKILAASMTVKMEFTLGFAPDDGVTRYFLNMSTAAGGARTLIAKLNTNVLNISVGNTTTVLNIVYATWSAALVAGKNVLVVTTTSGATSAWLNGTLIGTSATAWVLQVSPTLLTIGSLYNAVSRFVGTIHAVEIYGSVATSTDEPHLRDGSVVSDIDLDKCLAYLPGKTYYRNDAGLFVTDVGGRIGGTALMGSDGATATQFPSIIRPRGFSFDGGDQINLGDDDRYSFTDGVSDKPFSIAALVRLNTVAGGFSFITKVNSYIPTFVGEWGFFVGIPGFLYFRQVDSVSLGYIGIVSSTAFVRPGINYVFVATSAGAGQAGMRLYANGYARPTANMSSGIYSRMRNTNVPVKVGMDSVPYAMNGSITLPVIDDREWSPLQVKAITARLLRLARTP